MNRALVSLSFAIAATMALASCSTATSTPASADAGIEAGGPDGAPDLAVGDSMDVQASVDAALGDTATATEDGGGSASDSDGDSIEDAGDLADMDEAPDVAEVLGDTGVDAATCPTGTACAVPCCAAATCTAAGECACAGPLCDDGNPCTQDLCDSAACAHIPTDATPCDDGDPCTLADACTTGTCEGTAKDCSDGNPCTADTCAGGTCVQLPADGTPCDDGLLCTGPGACAGGQCSAGSAVNCDDGNACTSDFCAEYMLGCAHYSVNFDGDFCTLAAPCPVIAVCDNGKCTATDMPVCNDENPCTSDACDSSKGCVHLPTAGTCADDGNPCTDDICGSGKCGVVKKDGTSCASGTGCDAAVTCQQGKCLGGQEVWTVDMPPGEPAFPPAFDESGGVALRSPSGVRGYSWDGTKKWEYAGPVADGPVTVQGGWAFRTGTGLLQVLDLSGKPKSAVPFPATGPGAIPPLCAGGNGDVFLVSAPPSQVTRVGLEGAIQQSWSTPLGNVLVCQATVLSGGDLLFPSWSANGPAMSMYSIYRLSPAGGALGLFVPPLIKFSSGVPSPFDGILVTAEAPDLSLYMAQWRRTSALGGSVALFVWRADPSGIPVWNIVLPLPGQPPTANEGTVALASLADNTVEVSACPEISGKSTGLFKQGCRSWRLDGDGTVLWSRDEDQRRRVVSQATGKGAGVAALVWHYQGFPANATHFLTRSDAFGNITCAESGPCWDKPATYCDDGDPCTNDLCGAQWSGCHHEPFADGMPCKPGKTCQKGKCVP